MPPSWKLFSWPQETEQCLRNAQQQCGYTHWQLLTQIPLPRLELMLYHLEKKQNFNLAAPLRISLGLLKILGVWSLTPQKQHAINFLICRKMLMYP